MIQSSILDCSILELQKIKYRAGNITPLEGLRDIPFEIQRLFYIYDIPGGVKRGGHAHYQCHQLIIAASGSFDVELDDGKNKKTFNLNRPYYALHVVPGVWNNLSNFSSGAICLVMASEKYSEEDYIRNYQEYLKLAKK